MLQLEFLAIFLALISNAPRCFPYSQDFHFFTYNWILFAAWYRTIIHSDDDPSLKESF